MRYTNVRPMRPAKRKSQAKFTAIVFVTAIAAFTATMIWPREGAEPVAIAAVPAGTPAYDFGCVVEYVNDGDTLRCADGTRVRFHAIAARETDNSCSPGHPCPSASHEESKAALERLAGREIRCVRTGTSYNRVTAICDNAAGIEINCAMVDIGAAALWDKFNRQRPICQG